MALKILLADDSMTAQKMGEKILEEAGYEVVAVSNGAAATKKIASEKPDLVILDIYMPGYTGLEICQKVKADPATARVPVVLTVGQVEPYNPEDAERVKADGVIVKPFVPTDLVAAIKKIEEKLAAAAAPPPPPIETVEITAPAVSEFPDASYQEWKEAAEEHPVEEAPRRVEVSVPDEMAAAPAFGLDMLGEEPAPAPPPPAAPKPVASHATDSLVEFTSAPQAGEVAHAIDPALVTDASEMATAFPTKFGVEGAEVMPGGFIPEMMEAAAPAVEEPAAAEPVAEAAPVEVAAPPPEPEPVPVAVAAPPSEEDRLQIAREMQAAVADMPVEPVPAEEAAPAPAPEPEPAPVAVAATPSAETHSDLELAAAMAVAVGATAEPVVAAPAAATTSLDANTIAMIVHKITERMKPQLIEEIARELAAEAERTRR